MGRIRDVMSQLLPHRKRLAEQNERIREAQAGADEAKKRFAAADAAAQRAAAYRRDNRFSSIIADSLGIPRNNHS